MNKADLRAKIEETKLKEEVVHIDEWDADVLIQELNGSRLIYLSKISLDKKNNVDEDKFYIYAIINSTYTTDKEKLFTVDDYKLIEDLPSGIFSTLMQKIVEINNITGSKNPKN